MKVVIMGSQARSMANFWPTLIKMLVSEGHEVYCFVPQTNDEADKKAIELMRSWGAVPCEVYLSRRGLNPFKDFISFLSLRMIFRYVKPQVLFSYAIKPVIYGTLAAKFGMVPLRFAMITGLGYTFEADSLPKKLLTKVVSLMYWVALKCCHGVFFQNQDDLGHFKKLGILPKQPKPDYVQMIRGTGVDIERFAAQPPVVNEQIFLLVGRVIEAKGIREYAQAAKLLKAKYPLARFQLLGPLETGPGSIAKPEIEAWQNEGYIEYLGATDDVRPFISKASVMVLPSYREGLPTSIMEGMSMARPAVVTDVPGCRELLVEGENGFMVPWKNPQALAEGMEKFIQHPELIEKMGKTARQMAEKDYNARTVAQGLIRAMRLYP